MKKVQAATIKPQPYPYEIPPVTCPKIMPNPWHALEFLRIEALLRSPTLHKLYRRKTKYIHEKYSIGWYVLKGGHHSWLVPQDELEPGNPQGWGDKGLRDIGAIAKHLLPEQLEALKGDITADDSHLMYVEINPAFPPKTILEALRPILAERHKTTSDERGITRRIRHLDHRLNPYGWIIPFHTRIKPPIRDIKTWLNYLRCYDLRHCQGLSFGQIAKQVYGNYLKRDLAEKAYVRVARLIQAAEKNDWPPSRL